MAALEIREAPAAAPARLSEGAGGPLGPAGGSDGGGDGDGGKGQHLPRRTYFTALWLALAGSFMIFAALASSYIVRRGLGGDWQALHLPPILWFNTLALLGSSALVEWARRGLAAGRLDAFRMRWLSGTTLGLMFLGGQGVAWWELHRAGMTLSANISASFFYVLTVAHALHVLVGVGALLYVAALALKGRAEAKGGLAADLSALYWHVLDGVWLCVLGLMLVWR